MRSKAPTALRRGRRNEATRKALRRQDGDACDRVLGKALARQELCCSESDPAAGTGNNRYSLSVHRQTPEKTERNRCMGLEVGERQLCQATTVDHKLLTGNESRLRTSQPENGVGDILRRTESTNGVKRFYRLIDGLAIGICRQ